MPLTGKRASRGDSSTGQKPGPVRLTNGEVLHPEKGARTWYEVGDDRALSDNRRGEDKRLSRWSHGPEEWVQLPPPLPERRSMISLSDAWISVKDGDDRARALYLRHYSARHYVDARTRRLFVGPGEKMVLLTPEADALFIWRKFISDDGQDGVNCAVFRNEGPRLSSDLIRGACELAWLRWPSERLYTYVNPRKVASSNPGYCFMVAGWKKCGTTKNGLLILDIWR